MDRQESLMSLPSGALHGKRIPNEATAAGAAGLRAFARIAELWHLSIAEQLTLLGLSSRSTYFKWQKEPKVRHPHDRIERISHVLGIYKALQLLLPDTRAADECVRRPNDASVFG